MLWAGLGFGDKTTQNLTGERNWIFVHKSQPWVKIIVHNDIGFPKIFHLRCSFLTSSKYFHRSATFCEVSNYWESYKSHTYEKPQPDHTMHPLLFRVTRFYTLTLSNLFSPLQVWRFIYLRESLQKIFLNSSCNLLNFLNFLQNPKRKKIQNVTKRYLWWGVLLREHFSHSYLVSVQKQFY